jgi:3,4-dihydroxy-2-butanone 4-phosphate synthase
MVQNNEDLYKTAYTVSIDAKMGVTTGISAADRAHTINLLSSPSSLDPALFSRPGHVFPLRARPRGVLERVGHTEASIDLCRLAGKQPVAAISEIVLDDGRMARRDDLVLFAKQHGLLICCISDLVKYVMESM